MKYIFTLVLSLFAFSGLIAMENPRDTIIFENNSKQTVAVPTQIVNKITALNTAYVSHELGSSIGTFGRVRLFKQELQDFKLLKDCLGYNELNPEQIRSELSNKLSDTSHLIKIMEMASELRMPHVSQAVAHIIGAQFQSAKSRCQAFKVNQLAGLTTKPEILNQIGQAIIEPTGAKYYWLTRIKEQNNNYAQGMNIEQQLNNHLSPQAALVLVDAYENRVNKAPISYAPGAERAVPRILQDFIKLNKVQTLSYAWKHANPTHKWSMAGLGAASIAAAGYGLYSWYTAK